MRVLRLNKLDARATGWWLTLAFSGLVALFVALQIIAYRDYPFDTDEAFHANGGLTLALDLRARDWGAFVVDSYRQSAYPPAFSWLEALVMALFGASPLVARMCSLVCLVGAAVVLYAIGLELDDQFGWLIGLVSVGLTLTAQVVLVYSAMAMLEVPGLLVSLATLWAYLRAAKQPTAAKLGLVSLLMALTMLAKYPYGTVVVPTIMVMEVLALQNVRRRALLAKRWAWLFGPFVLIMLAWFARPYKIAAFFEYATSQPAQVSLFSIENLVYYPRSIAFHFSPSPVTAILILGGVVYAIARWRDERLRVLLIYLAIGLLEMTFKLQKHPRFIATIVPAAHLLTGALLAWLVSRRLEGWMRARAASIAITTAVVVCLLAGVSMLIERFAAFPSLMQVHYQTDPRSADLAAWIVAQVPDGQRFYLINPWDQFSAPALEWYRAVRETRPGVRWADVWTPSTFLKPATPEHADELWRSIQASGARYVVVLEGGPEGEQVWPTYADTLNEALVPVAQQGFAIQQWRRDVPQWLKRSLLTRAGLEQQKSKGRYTMNIRATVYRWSGV